MTSRHVVAAALTSSRDPSKALNHAVACRRVLLMCRGLGKVRTPVGQPSLVLTMAPNDERELGTLFRYTVVVPMMVGVMTYAFGLLLWGPRFLDVSARSIPA